MKKIHPVHLPHPIPQIVHIGGCWSLFGQGISVASNWNRYMEDFLGIISLVVHGPVQKQLEKYLPHIQA
jgi:hypothetical protein